MDVFSDRMWNLLLSPPSAMSGEVSVSCELDDNSCILDYHVVLSGPYNTIGRVFIGEERGQSRAHVKSFSTRAVPLQC